MPATTHVATHPASVLPAIEIFHNLVCEALRKGNAVKVETIREMDLAGNFTGLASMRVVINAEVAT